MIVVIIDGYIDELVGLGVFFYFGIYLRYVYGVIKKVRKDVLIFYFIIDDLCVIFLGEGGIVI